MSSLPSDLIKIEEEEQSQISQSKKPYVAKLLHPEGERDFETSNHLNPQGNVYPQGSKQRYIIPPKKQDSLSDRLN